MPFAASARALGGTCIAQPGPMMTPIRAKYRVRVSLGLKWNFAVERMNERSGIETITMPANGR